MANTSFLMEYKTFAVKVVMVILHLMKMMAIFIQAITLIPILGALHVLCSLSCTSTLQVTSYHFHFAQEKIEA